MSAQPEAARDAFDQAFDRVVKTTLEFDSIPPDDLKMSDAGVDSFGLVNLMMALEDEFDGMWPLEYLAAPCQMTALGVLRSLTREVLYGKNQMKPHETGGT